MLGIKQLYLKNHRDRWFSIPILTLNPFWSSRQCAAVRTQDGWMRTPPHRNIPSALCSIIWNKTREVWHCMEHSSQNTVFILCGYCQIHKFIKHQSMSQSLMPKLYRGTKALWIEALWNTYKNFWMSFLNEGWLQPNKHEVMLVTAKKHFVFKALKYRAQMRDVSHTRHRTSSQAAALTLWCKRSFNSKGNQALIICIH